MKKSNGDKSGYNDLNKNFYTEVVAAQTCPEGRRRGATPQLTFYISNHKQLLLTTPHYQLSTINYQLPITLETGFMTWSERLKSRFFVDKPGFWVSPAINSANEKEQWGQKRIQ